jgi:hypothetical protein
MTELAIRPEGEIEPFTPTPRESAAVVSLIEWAEQARAASQLAETLCRTSFVPAHFKGKPIETAAAILTGAEVGLSPMAALRSIFVISGTPGMYARTMVALVQSQGHEVWVVEQSDDKVTVGGRRKDSEREHFATWDRARVLKAKLQSNAKYQETPQQMLYARASSEICRQIAADVLLGIPYSVEELWDMPPEVEPRARLTAADVIGAAPAAIEQSSDEAEVVDEPAPEPEPDEPAALMITEKQLTKLHATLGDLGWNERAKGLAEISKIVDEPITSSKQLTKVEAIRVIDALETKLRERREADSHVADSQVSP